MSKRKILWTFDADMSFNIWQTIKSLFGYKVSIQIEFTKEEIELLIEQYRQSLKQ